MHTNIFFIANNPSVGYIVRHIAYYPCLFKIFVFMAHFRGIHLSRNKHVWCQYDPYL